MSNRLQQLHDAGQSIWLDFIRLSLIAGAGYLGLVTTTLVQALRARPLLSPDSVTLALGAVTLLACVIAAAFTLTPLARAAYGRRPSGQALGHAIAEAVRERLHVLLAE